MSQLEDRKASETKASGATTAGDDPPKEFKRRRRHANLYDAVAGRVFIHQPLHHPSQSRSPLPALEPLPPEEVLFRQRRAPARYEEQDVYFGSADALLLSAAAAAGASRRGGGGTTDDDDDDDDDARRLLPDGDLLKSVHAYAAGFYAALARHGDGGFPGGPGPSAAAAAINNIDARSLDETALLAVGVLLEEAARSALGPTGDLVFTEGMREEEEEEGEGEGEGRAGGDGGRDEREVKREDTVVGFEADRFWTDRRRRDSAGVGGRRKRRRLAADWEAEPGQTTPGVRLRDGREGRGGSESRRGEGHVDKDGEDRRGFRHHEDDDDDDDW